MPRARRARRAGSRTKAQPVPPVAVPEDLNAAIAALLEAEDGRMGRQPDVAAEGSVQDPLADWPEVETEQDRWVLERPGEGVEEAGD
jgi:hypothetical protein